jgi:hypothetical protein
MYDTDNDQDSPRRFAAEDAGKRKQSINKA